MHANQRQNCSQLPTMTTALLPLSLDSIQKTLPLLLSEAQTLHNTSRNIAFNSAFPSLTPFLFCQQVTGTFFMSSITAFCPSCRPSPPNLPICCYSTLALTVSDINIGFIVACGPHGPRVAPMNIVEFHELRRVTSSTSPLWKGAKSEGRNVLQISE